MYMLILLLGICSAFSLSSSEKIVGCYYDSNAIFRPSKGKFGIANINASLCTHVLYTYSGKLNNGVITLEDATLDKANNGFKRFDEFRKKNPSVKTILSVAGWTRGSVEYSAIVSDTKKRQKFVDNLVYLLTKYKFDGYDFDWEYPGQRDGKRTDKENFVKLLSEMRAKFDQYHLIFCVSVGATESTAKISYNIAEISKHAHMINLMAYQFHSPYDEKATVVGANTPLYSAKNESNHDKTLNVNYAVQYWLKGGAAKEKILLGIALSGNSYTLKSPINKYGRGAKFSDSGVAGKYTQEFGNLGYNEICELIKYDQWKEVYDNEQRVPYAYKNSQLASYENVQSLKEKSEYIEKNKLGGVIMFSIDTDDFLGVCGEEYPLLKTVNRLVRKMKNV